MSFTGLVHAAHLINLNSPEAKSWISCPSSSSIVAVSGALSSSADLKFQACLALTENSQEIILKTYL